MIKTGRVIREKLGEESKNFLYI